jgi:heat shock protein HtpX
MFLNIEFLFYYMTLINQLKTVILLGFLTGILLWVSNLIGGTQGLTIALIFAIIMNIGSYWFSDRIVLAIYRAKPISREENKELYDLVKDIAGKAKIKMPKVCIINAPFANAFATGRNEEHSAVVVTKGIIDLLLEEELKGVIAHEISHIKNKDTLIQAVAATIAGVISYVAFMARWAAIFGGMGGDRDNSGIELLVLAILTPILATLIQLAISRSREYLADESGAKIVGSGKELASALEKLESSKTRISLRPNSRTQTTAHLFITNPFKSSGLLHLFLTHPPTKKRIEKLKEIKF